MRLLRAITYAVAGLVTVSGGVVTWAAASERNWLPAMGGAAVVIGAAVAVILMQIVSRQDELLVRLAAELRAIRERMDSLESLADLQAVEMNLSAAGSGDSSRLVGASLEHDTYPRILSDEPTGKPADEAAAAAPEAPRQLPSTAPRGPSAGVWRRWQLALADEDYPAAREALQSMADTLGDDEFEQASDRLAAVCRAYAARLRTRFAEQVRSGDFAGALLTGSTLAANFADSPAAAEFARLKPILEARLSPAPAPVRASVG